VLERGLAPADYVIREFDARDVVLLGEHGMIRHDVLLVRAVVPRLPGAGVARLGVEFVGAADQEPLDRLVAADEWDETLARALVRRTDPAFGAREYLDLLRAAQTVNREGRGRLLRVVGLGGAPRDALRALEAAGALEPGEKTLILARFESAFTRFRLPSPGLGNLVHDAVGDRAATVLLHAPWPSALGPGAPAVYPADGHIDASMIALSDENRRAGFDLAGSAFAALPVGTSAWGLLGPDVTLGDLADGYVFQTAIHDDEGVTPIEGWLEDEAAMAELRAACDIPHRFRRYH